VGYFHQRRVSLGAREPDGIAATVEGSQGTVYEVQFDWSEAESEGLLTLSCSCPRFAGFTVCKHIWATMVAFDHAQFTEPVPGLGPLELVVASPSLAGSEDQEGGSLEDSLIPREGKSPGLRVKPNPPGRERASNAYARPSEPRWKQHLGIIRAAGAASGTENRNSDLREVTYRLNITKCFHRNQLVVDLYQRKQKKNGELGKLTRLNLDREPTGGFTDEADQNLIRVFLDSQDPEAGQGTYRFSSGKKRSSGIIPPVLYTTILPKLCATGRLGWILDRSKPTLTWDGGPPWRLSLEMVELQGTGSTRIVGWLHRDGERRPLADPVLLQANGIVVWQDQLSTFTAEDTFPWVSLLRRERHLDIPESDLDALLEELSTLPILPALELPSEWQWEEVRATPSPELKLRPAPPPRTELLEGKVSFDYEGHRVPASQESSRIFDRREHRIIHRDLVAEKKAAERLETLGFRSTTDLRGRQHNIQLGAEILPRVAPLLEEGWLIEIEGQPLRAASDISFKVSSGIDWFELRGELKFAGTSVAIPRLLAAVRRGDRLIRLDDGSQGMLPEAWIERYMPLAKLAHGEAGEAVRYLPSQATLLDTLLAAEPEADFDSQFAQIRQRLEGFEKIEPAHQPRGFRGQLRDYQREGLAWLKFLSELGLGGCLADDMGLGKTVQILALLQELGTRANGESTRRPSLIVAPRSLLHNWIEEAERFTPNLRVISYSGPDRKEKLGQLADTDVLVTTYGLLRRDIHRLRVIEFDYAILDEAQAIKNASAQSTKAARLIRAEHRLALTGTPVENHIGELWSLFEFLNPGMLGRLPAFKSLTQKPVPAPKAFSSLARALRPFILRRTKGEVLHDLPAKTEQTLFCELDSKESKLYTELRDHYRNALEQRIGTDGLGRSKIHVLEALLRLRQAACHPGLVDPARSRQSSAKLDTLLEHLDEVIRGGHKALVFSQFVRLLEIVKRHLTERGVPFEYLDGKTRDRKRRIDRFQTAPDCQVFLISLKAGGLGLNLTAADYVFVLDPWWNPAVEAQAVDRAHRIGQTRPVFAYRLIARDTVEEKILSLQQSKRELADAILPPDGSVIGNLSVDDLQLLLS